AKAKGKGKARAKAAPKSSASTRQARARGSRTSPSASSVSSFMPPPSSSVVPPTQLNAASRSRSSSSAALPLSPAPSPSTSDHSTLSPNLLRHFSAVAEEGRGRYNAASSDSASDATGPKTPPTRLVQHGVPLPVIPEGRRLPLMSSEEISPTPRPATPSVESLEVAIPRLLSATGSATSEESENVSGEQSSSFDVRDEPSSSSKEQGAVHIGPQSLPAAAATDREAIEEIHPSDFVFLDIPWEDRAGDR
ncbi:hypothetical protein FOZ63_013052, partial [Perkinsus olseni]